MNIPSYQSIPSAAEVPPPTAEHDSSSSSPIQLKRMTGGPLRKQLVGLSVVVAISVVVVLVGLPPLLTPEEKTRKYHQAQKLALEGHARLANPPDSMIPNFSFLGHARSEQHKKSHHHETKEGTPLGCEGTILIIRHCEKESVREHCDYQGYERSVYLSTLFGDGDERWPAPSYIYALSPDGRHNKKKMNFREIETVGSLSEKVNVPVDYSYTTSHTNKLADHLLDNLHQGAMCGKVALVSWKHSNIGHLAHRLGCGPAQGCPMDYRGKSFDEVWQIKFVYREFEHSVRKNLKLRGPEWKIFGSVQQEGFDPLAFSKVVGDYPPGGNDGKDEPGWKPEAAEIQERKHKNDESNWTNQSKVAFLAVSHPV